MTNAQLISRDGCPEAWLAACEYLKTQDDWRAYNLIVEMTEPSILTEEGNGIYQKADGFLRKNDRQSLSTVANTIFPLSYYRKYGVHGVYERYPDAYPKIKKHPSVRWGTYAHRMLRRTVHENNVINPLEVLVEKLKGQLKRPGPMRAAYELSIEDPATDLAIYDPASDRNLPIGGPCLAHVSFKLSPEKKLITTAMYRSHFYIERALGNFIGLAQLQSFVCEQANIPPGSLVSVSTMAILDRKSKCWGKQKIKQLLADCSA